MHRFKLVFILFIAGGLLPAHGQVEPILLPTDDFENISLQSVKKGKERKTQLTTRFFKAQGKATPDWIVKVAQGTQLELQHRYSPKAKMLIRFFPMELLLPDLSSESIEGYLMGLAFENLHANVLTAEEGMGEKLNPFTSPFGQDQYTSFDYFIRNPAEDTLICRDYLIQCQDINEGDYLLLVTFQRTEDIPQKLFADIQKDLFTFELETPLQ